MANGSTPNLGLILPENFKDTNVWGTHLNIDLTTIDALFPANGSGTSVGLHIGTTKTLQVDTGASLNVNALSLKIADDVDNTKVLNLNISNVTSGTTQTIYVPNAPGAMLATRLTGEVLQGFFGNVAPTGYVFCNNASIGSSTSSATQRANNDTQPLYNNLWPFFPVGPGGRGVSAAADWTANKFVCTPDMRGRALITADNNGGVTSAAVLSPSGIASTTMGATGGAATTSAGVSGSCSVSVSGGVSVGVSCSGSLGGQIVSGSASAGGTAGGSTYAVLNDQVAVSGTLNGGGSGSFSGGGSGSISGGTAAFVTVPPVMVVSTLIAL